jgi:alcohol dehydrogenase (cytochrome c)
VPIAFNPSTGLVYASTWNLPRIQKLAPPTTPPALGANTTGVASRLPEVKPGEALGHFVAINPLTGEKKWEIPLTDFPSSAGMLATGGGLVFTGKPTGEFLALDEATGKTLWQFKTGSSSSRPLSPIRTTAGSSTIASGRGGGANLYAAGRSPGGSVWTFALMP